MVRHRDDRQDDPAPPGLELIEREHGTDVSLNSPALTFHHSFIHGELPRRAGQARQALLKACRNRQGSISQVLDLTAGWGADALTLASHGLAVTMLESEPQILRVLQHSLACLRNHDAELAGRMRLVGGNALDFLQASGNYDCIYLDPMFPAHKSTARAGKTMQILQEIAQNVALEAAFRLALDRATWRVVVKRPARAGAFDQRDPDIVYREKSIRFDVYLPAAEA